MSDQAMDVRRQFGVYADAITGFATAQMVGFTILMAQGGCFTRNVLGGLRYAVWVGVLANVAYVVFIFLCHSAADKIPMESVATAAALDRVRKLRYIIVTAGLLVTVLLPFAIDYGWHHGNFFIDCKAGDTHPSTAGKP